MATFLQDEALKNLYATDHTLRLNALSYFRQLLSTAEPTVKISLMDQLIHSGILPPLIELLQHDTAQPQLQLEAARILTDIASGTSKQTHSVIQHGAVPLCIRLIAHPPTSPSTTTSMMILEQCISILGAIAKNGMEARIIVLKEGALKPLLKIISQINVYQLSTIQKATWAISNLCSETECVNDNLEFMTPETTISVLSQLLFHADATILSNVAWAFACLSRQSEVWIDRMIQERVVRLLVGLMNHRVLNVATPALRTIGNIVSGNEFQTQVVIHCQALPSLCRLISHPKKDIRKEACWAVSNIMAGSVEQIQACMDANIIPKLLKHMEASGSMVDTKKEATWALLNAILNGSNAQIMDIMDKGRKICVEIFCDLIVLNMKDMMKRHALSALAKVVQACRSNEARYPDLEEMIEKKGLWHEVMYNHLRGTAGYEKKLKECLTKPISTRWCDIHISCCNFDQMEVN